jgi:predicted nucleic acid-binding protein
MVKALFDSNILIDNLSEIPQARDELRRFEHKAISIITKMEVLVGTDETDEAGVRSFLSGFEVIPLDEDIAERAVASRKQHRIKLPDAVIWASAQAHGMILVTRNTKDFPKDDPGIRAHYAI